MHAHVGAVKALELPPSELATTTKTCLLSSGRAPGGTGAGATAGMGRGPALPTGGRVGCGACSSHCWFQTREPSLATISIPSPLGRPLLPHHHPNFSRADETSQLQARALFLELGHFDCAAPLLFSLHLLAHSLVVQGPRSKASVCLGLVRRYGLEVSDRRQRLEALSGDSGV